ncbi:Basic leucine zipper bZIP transcription factor [Schistosoma japonicum]|nr:Basic leucine zipper bZIP transcription factor [Schistosoma japonicum]
MSTVSTCSNKLTNERGGVVSGGSMSTTPPIENFNLHHHGAHSIHPLHHLDNTALYSMNHHMTNTTSSSPFQNESSLEQRRRNASLPAPHLLLQSKLDYSRTSLLDTHSHNNTGSVNSANNPYCTSNSMNYSDISEAVNLNHCDQTLDIKQQAYINSTTNTLTTSTTTSITSIAAAASVTNTNYHNGTRNLNYIYSRDNNLLSSPYEHLTDSLSGAYSNNNNNHEYMNYSSNIPESEFGHWSTSASSLAGDLKITSRSSGFHPHILNDTQQLSSCVNGFPVLSQSTVNTTPGFTNMNRCSVTCPTPRNHENHSVHQSGSHITTGNIHTQQHNTFQSNGYCNTSDNNYENGPPSPSNLICAQSMLHSKINSCDIKNPSQVVANRSSRSASTPTRLLIVSTASPVTSTITMTPDSSTIGFAGNKFGCSSDDGEASPTPTCSSGCPQTPGRTRKPAPTLATGRRNLKGELVDPDEADRRMKRRERNRKSAQKCRERKVQRTHELQSQVECLQLEASRLMQELESWRSRAKHCVALLQHHCPGVSIPYLSCLNEIPACLNNFKEPLDDLSDLLASDKNMDCETQPYGEWKTTKPSGKTYTINEVSDESFISNEEPSSILLPPVNLLHSHVTPNRSKSLFGFSSNNSSTKDDDTRMFTQNSELNKLPIHNQDHDITDSMLIPMSRSTSQVSVRGPASGSSSSSCSTYELSFPSLETNPHNLNETITFKDYSQTNLMSILSSRDESRVMSGQDLLDNSVVIMTNKSTSVGDTSSSNGSSSNQQTWSLDYHGSVNKNITMDCSSPLSPLTTPSTNIVNSQFQNNNNNNNKEYQVNMDSKCYDPSSSSSTQVQIKTK